MQVNSVLHGAAVLCEVDTADVVSGHWPILLHEHVDRVDPVHELIGENSAAEIAIVAEVEILRRIPLPPAYRAQVPIPIEIGGFLFHPGRRGVPTATSAGRVGAASAAAIKP